MRLKLKKNVKNSICSCGLSNKIPYSEYYSDADHPIQVYAATKRSNELISYAYSHLFDLHVTGLRYFTVYGPWYRPDMAIFIFLSKIVNFNKTCYWKVISKIIV